ncbi:MAG: CDP-glycerol glycerophosphotransferase family protein [Candidatus Scatosoma sp.]
MAQYTVKKVFQYLKLKDIANLFICILVFPFAIIAKLFVRGFWLVCEDKNEARDNGYWFFRYVRQHHPNRKIAYAINKSSPDYVKVKDLGKVISYGGVSHWFWYIVADKNVSSQKGGKPNAAVCYLFEVALKLRRHNRIFLQHGVTLNNGAWLYKKNCYFDKFICAAKPEYEYIKNNFGYSEKELCLTGFARYDNLNDDVTENDLILIMPSWRQWLSGAQAEEDEKDFINSTYFKEWNGLLSDERFTVLLKKYGKRAIFYPHRNMQNFLNKFEEKSGYISVADWKNYDVQELLKRAALLITDYSSIFFDFAYMRKPTVFYQFDEEEFRERQYKQGWFDYRSTPLGDYTKDRDTLLQVLEKRLADGIKKLDGEKIKDIFGYSDNGNNERIYNAITK